MSEISTESGRPEAAQELSGVVERMIEAISQAKCPITMSGSCEYPELCIGCYETINQELNQ
jgi:hypothetical protein